MFVLIVVLPRMRKRCNAKASNDYETIPRREVAMKGEGGIDAGEKVVRTEKEMERNCVMSEAAACLSQHARTKCSI